MRLIDADALLNALDELVAEANEEYDNDVMLGLSCAKSEVHDAPTIDAIPVEWLNWRAKNAKYNKIVEAADAFEFVLKCWKEQEEQDG